VRGRGGRTAGEDDRTREAVPRQVSRHTQDASVSLVGLKDMKELKRYKVGPRPYGIAVSPDGKTVAVGVEDEEKVKFFDADSFEPRGEFKVGKMFNDHIVLTRDGKNILVANFYSDDTLTWLEAHRAAIRRLLTEP
jgi:DNA-binding beta-propeller fold protein YncE